MRFHRRNTAKVRAYFLRVLTVPIAKASKTYKDIERLLTDIKPYIEQVRNINATTASTLDREWKDVWDQKTMYQRLVSRWSALPKQKRDRLVDIHKAAASKLVRNVNRADRNARHRKVTTSATNERNYYGHDVLYPRTKQRDASTRGGLERFMFPRTWTGQ